MSLKMNVDIIGVDEAIAKINKMDIETRIAVRKQVRKSGLRLGKNMRARVPIGATGNLKKSIKTKFSPDQLSAEVGPTYGKGSHAHLVEFGHRLIINGQSKGHVPAHPFITPSSEEERPKYMSEMSSAIKGAVKK